MGTESLTGWTKMIMKEVDFFVRAKVVVRWPCVADIVGMRSVDDKFCRQRCY